MKARKRRLRLFPVILAVLLLCAAAYYLLCLNRPGTMPRQCPARSEGDLRIATLNVARLGMISSPEAETEFLLAAVERNDVDVLVMQEFSEKYKFSFEDFKKIFGQSYPYVRFSGEQAIASRLPFEVLKDEDFNLAHGSYTSYMLGGIGVKLVSVHLHTTGVSGAMRSGDIGVAGTAGVMSSNRKARLHQAEAVREEVLSSACPVIVAGDFNSMPLTKVYRKIRSAGLQDTFMEKGQGNGSTFRSFKNLLRIDYILPDRLLTVRDHLVCDDYLSDHRLVIATVRAPAAGKPF